MPVANGRARDASLEGANKVPKVALRFWLIRIPATPLGETGGDTVAMTRNWGYLAGEALSAAIPVVLVAAQTLSKRFRPAFYWMTIVASATFGTTMADFADRSLGIGYSGGSTLLLACLAAVLAVWNWVEESSSGDTVATPGVEASCWAAVTFSPTLGTALGEWLADTGGLGYGGGDMVFAAALAVVVFLYARAKVSRVTLFWAAFILTRPLGATVGDFLDKSVAEGGLTLNRPAASLVLIALGAALVVFIPQRPGWHPNSESMVTK